MWALKILFGLVGPLISLGMIAFILGEMLSSAHTRSIMADDLFGYLWALGPYLAVALGGYFVRSNLVAAAFTLLAAVVSTATGFYVLYPYLLEDGNNVGKGMAIGIVPVMQWLVLGVIAVVGLTCVLIQRSLQRYLFTAMETDLDKK